MTYGVDLRERVVEFVNEGGAKTKAARLFKVSRWCVYDWCERPCLAPARTKTVVHVKVSDQDLQTHVAEHPDAYQKERAVALGVSNQTISRRLKALKISRKKNDTVQRKKRQLSQ